MTLVEHTKSDPSAAQARRVAAGDDAPMAGTTMIGVAQADSPANTASAAEGDGLGLLLLGLVVIGTYLARR